MKEAGASVAAESVLGEILELAKEQVRQLSRGDLKAGIVAQQRRQELLERVQGLDDPEPGIRQILSEILDRDRRTMRLLLAEQADIRARLQRIPSLRKLLGSQSKEGTHPRSKLSKRA